MQIDIRERAELDEAEWDALRALDHAVYPPKPAKPNEAQPQVEWVDGTWLVLVWDDNQQLVSTVGMLTRQGLCDDTAYLIGGIGSVQTHPDARRQGYARTALRHAAEFLREELEVDFSLLVCRDELIPYYGGLGWQFFDGDILVNQSSGQTLFTFDKPMLMAGTKPLPTCDVIDLCGKPW